jgi:hypothetical protein
MERLPRWHMTGRCARADGRNPTAIGQPCPLVRFAAGLPKAVRQALANADHNWSGEQLYKERRAKKHQDRIGTIAKAVAFIRGTDVNKHREDAAAGLVCPRSTGEGK